jgi:raffinose/stachyose/melibiose transport system substrate-binding protein
MSTLRKFRLLRLVVSSLILVAIAACAQAPQEEAPAVLEPTPEGEQVAAEPAQPTAGAEEVSEPVVIKWWTAARGEYDPMVDELFVDAFNSSHDDIQLEFVRRENLDDVTRMALQAGTGPDIIQMAAGVTDLVRAGLVKPLDEYAAQFGWEEEMMPWAYETSVIRGHLYAIPQQYETILLFYNKVLFEQNGWSPPESLEDIEYLCSEADRLGKTCFGSTTEGRVTRNEWWLGWVINAYAGPDKFYQTITGETPWTDQAFAEAVELQRKWIVDDGWFGGGLDRYFTLSHDENWASMQKGETLMRVSGSFDLRRMYTLCPDDCDWVIPPSLNPSIPPHYLLAIGEFIAIAADSPHPDEAAVVMDYMFNDRARAAKIIEGFNFGLWLVPLNWSASDFSPEADPRLVRFVEEFSQVTGAGNYGYTTWTFLPADTRYYLNEGFEAVMFGDTTIEDYLAELQTLLASEWEVIPPAPKTAIGQ